MVKATSAFAPTAAPTSAAARAMAHPVDCGVAANGGANAAHSPSAATMIRAIVDTASTG